MLSTITWLRNNDAKAQEIVQNGKSLFTKLYSLSNMVEDAVSTYTKYASLMKYTPEIPDKKYLWRKKVLDGDTISTEDDDDEEDEDEEND